MDLLEVCTVRTYRNGSHIFSIEKSEVSSRPTEATFRIETADHPFMLAPNEVPENIVSRQELIDIITDMS